MRALSLQRLAKLRRKVRRCIDSSRNGPRWSARSLLALGSPCEAAALLTENTAPACFIFPVETSKPFRCLIRSLLVFEEKFPLLQAALLCGVLGIPSHPTVAVAQLGAALRCSGRDSWIKADSLFLRRYPIQELTINSALITLPRKFCWPTSALVTWSTSFI